MLASSLAAQGAKFEKCILEVKPIDAIHAAEELAVLALRYITPFILLLSIV